MRGIAEEKSKKQKSEQESSNSVSHAGLVECLEENQSPSGMPSATRTADKTPEGSNPKTIAQMVSLAETPTSVSINEKSSNLSRGPLTYNYKF